MVVGGGDGTIAAAGARLKGTGIALGILPLGTMNMLAKDLGIPLGLDAAALALAQGEIREIDVAEVNGHVFLCNSVIGSPSWLGRHRERQRGRASLRTRLAFAIAGLRAEWRHRPMRLRVELDARRRPVRLWTRAVAVANNRYAEGFGLFMARPRLDQGELALYIARRYGIWWWMRLMAGMFLGTWRGSKLVHEREAQQVTIRSPRTALRVMNDGEALVLASPLAYRIHPAALRVIVPPPPRAAEEQAPPPPRAAAVSAARASVGPAFRAEGPRWSGVWPRHRAEPARSRHRLRDLTQGARHRDSPAAMAFPARPARGRSSRCPEHDISPYIPDGALQPTLARWRRHGRRKPSRCCDAEIAVVGLNTARRGGLYLNWARGRVGRRRLARMEEKLAALPAAPFRVVVAHHPFVAPALAPLARVVGGAEPALAAFARHRVGLVLTGHLHLPDVRPPERSGGTLLVQAATATSHRLRGTPNAYHRVVVQDGAARVATRVWDGAAWRDA